MKIYAHPDCNTKLGPAPGDEEVVQDLPVLQGMVGQPGEEQWPVTRSFWVPDSGELELLRTGRFCVALTVMGATHAPVRVDVCDAKVDIARLRDDARPKLVVVGGENGIGG